MTIKKLTRRDVLHAATLATVGYSTSGWFKALADQSSLAKPRRACILLWMSGGPTQTDTFDTKLDHKNGGPFKSIASSVPGIAVSEHLPGLATRMKHLALVRSMTTKEGDHSRATQMMRTGYLPQGPIRYPSMGSLISKELENLDTDLPNFVSISPNRIFGASSYGPGFLGPKYAPLIIGEQQSTSATFNANAAFRVKNLDSYGQVDKAQQTARMLLLNGLEDEFAASHDSSIIESHHAAYKQARRLMHSESRSAFLLDQEPAELRGKYGNNQFGQGCLLARRLVEQGVPFVEVTLSRVPSVRNALGWDTHNNNFDRVKALSEVLDAGWSTLIDDLKDRGLLETTTIVWMGEFGRTPKINRNSGRDHFPTAWSTVIGGGGVNGGQAHGATNKDGTEIADAPVKVADFIATICKSLGIDPMAQNMSNVGRPIRIADPEATPIQALLS